MKKIPFKAYAAKVKKTQIEWALQFNTTQPTIGRWLQDEKYLVSLHKGQPVSVDYTVTCWAKAS